MKKVVIFAGGHGAVKLQQSIAKWAPDCTDVQIIISAYDNAKSTLACRQVFDHKILGVSDLRKNHITQYKIQKDFDGEHGSLYSTIHEWLEYRTRHHGGVVVQEPAPVMDIVPVGHLVTQITKHRRLLLTFVFDGLAQDIHQGDTLRSPTLTQTQEQLVEGFVLQSVVELAALGFLRHPQGQ